MRRPLVIGNWKLHGNSLMIKELISDLRKELININNCSVAIAPPAVYLDLAKRNANGSNIILSAQNVDINLSGAFTGETSVLMLKDIGVKYIIIGHSERRIYHKESNKLIAKKFSVIMEHNLIPVLCIGETKLEYEMNKTKEVCIHQIDAVLKIYGAAVFKSAIIAYEPIWAIGTGKSANPEQIQAVHKFIRNYIAETDIKASEEVIIQYGGSVNTSNAAKIFIQPDIDGALVGNASLKARDFATIVKEAEIAKRL